MLEIVICDDNSVYRDKIKQIIENTIIRESMDLKISLCTKNPEKIIEYVEKYHITGIYFLDVDLKSSMNGIKLGFIRKFPFFCISS